MIRGVWFTEPLHNAIISKDLKKIQSIITLSNVNTPMCLYGRTLLHTAIQLKWEELFRWLLRFPNIDIEYTSVGTGWNALTFALHSNAFVYDLLEAGADLTLVSKDQNEIASWWRSKQKRAIHECREICIMLLWGYLQFGGAELKPVLKKMARSLWNTRLNRYWLILVEENGGSRESERRHRPFH
jgi:hypothetical protein